MRLIDADEAYKILTDYYHQRTEIQHEALKEAFSRVPTVEVVLDFHAQTPRHGHWEIDMRGNWACSLCGNDPYHDNMKNMNYCPNCGAKMDEEGEDA